MAPRLTDDFLLLDDDDYEILLSNDEQQVNNNNNNNENNTTAGSDGGGTMPPLTNDNENDNRATNSSGTGGNNDDGIEDKDDNPNEAAVEVTEDQKQQENNNDESNQKSAELIEEIEDQQQQHGEEQKEEQEEQKQPNDDKKTVNVVTTRLLSGGDNGTVTIEGDQQHQARSSNDDNSDDHSRWIVVEDDGDPQEETQQQEQQKRLQNDQEEAEKENPAKDHANNDKDNHDDESSATFTVSIPIDGSGVLSLGGMSALTTNTEATERRKNSDADRNANNENEEHIATDVDANDNSGNINEDETKPGKMEQKDDDDDDDYDGIGESSRNAKVRNEGSSGTEETKSLRRDKYNADDSKMDQPTPTSAISDKNELVTTCNSSAAITTESEMNEKSSETASANNTPPLQEIYVGNTKHFYRLGVAFVVVMLLIANTTKLLLTSSTNSSKPFSSDSSVILVQQEDLVGLASETIQYEDSSTVHKNATDQPLKEDTMKECAVPAIEHGERDGEGGAAAEEQQEDQGKQETITHKENPLTMETQTIETLPQTTDRTTVPKESSEMTDVMEKEELKQSSDESTSFTINGTSSSNNGTTGTSKPQNNTNSSRHSDYFDEITKKRFELALLDNCFFHLKFFFRPNTNTAGIQEAKMTFQLGDCAQEYIENVSTLIRSINSYLRLALPSSSRRNDTNGNHANRNRTERSNETQKDTPTETLPLVYNYFQDVHESTSNMLAHVLDELYNSSNLLVQSMEEEINQNDLLQDEFWKEIKASASDIVAHVWDEIHNNTLGLLDSIEEEMQKDEKLQTEFWNKNLRNMTQPLRDAYNNSSKTFGKMQNISSQWWDKVQSKTIHLADAIMENRKSNFNQDSNKQQQQEQLQQFSSLVENATKTIVNDVWNVTSTVVTDLIHDQFPESSKAAERMTSMIRDRLQDVQEVVFHRNDDNKNNDDANTKSLWNRRPWNWIPNNNGENKKQP